MDVAQHAKTSFWETWKRLLLPPPMDRRSNAGPVFRHTWYMSLPSPLNSRYLTGCTWSDRPAYGWAVALGKGSSTSFDSWCKPRGRFRSFRTY